MTHPSQLPREFRMASGGFGRMVLPFVFVLLFFFAVMLVLGSIFAGVGGGIAIAAVATGVLVGVLYGKFRRMKEGTLVRFSEYGVELSDTLGFRVRLGWRDITRLGQVDTRMAAPDKFGSEDGVQVSVGSMKSLGIIGWGDRMIPPKAPGWMRENLDRQPRNPADGRPEVAIPLGGIDPNWTHGPMGQWVRLYRPDLLGPPPAAPTRGHPAPGQPWPGQPGQPLSGQPLSGQPGQPLPGQPSQPVLGQPSQPLPGPPMPGQPGQPMPGRPSQPVPGQAAPGQPAPGQAAPGQPALGQPALGQPAFGQPALGHAAPGHPAQPGLPPPGFPAPPVQPGHGWPGP